MTAGLHHGEKTPLRSSEGSALRMAARGRARVDRGSSSENLKSAGVARENGGPGTRNWAKESTQCAATRASRSASTRYSASLCAADVKTIDAAPFHLEYRRKGLAATHITHSGLVRIRRRRHHEAAAHTGAAPRTGPRTCSPGRLALQQTAADVTAAKFE